MSSSFRQPPRRNRVCNRRKPVREFPLKTFHLPPSPQLRPFIDHIWGWESTSAHDIPLPVLPPGTGAELYFHYGEPFRVAHPGDGQNRSASPGPGHLFCTRSQPVALAPVSGLGFIAIRFKIGGLYRFTQIPATELADTALSVEEIWSVHGKTILRHFFHASNNPERIRLIQTFLTSQIKTESADLLIEKAMPLLYRQCPACPIETLASTLGLGRRQLERRWKNFSGQSPGETRNLCRFQKTLRRLMLAPSAHPTDEALAHGYYDQAHFIHDFQRRTGLTPREYLRIARTKTHFYNTPLPANGILGPPPIHF